MSRVINVQNLIDTRENLVKEISSLKWEELNEKQTSEEWSIGQVCHHLIVSETVFTKAIVYGLKKNDQVNVEQKQVDLTLDRSRKIDAPEIVLPHDGPFDLHKLLEGLQESRSKLLHVLNSLEDHSILWERATKHPIFGELALNQWVDIVYLHEERHIEQIKELKALQVK
ncbi:DinB family protein [Bacillus salitolerans]|uniref:DinB family protein n=1 Tax=Bacillus salitolerans TaxID=1437434 RepID=A0ABW4LU65_9BACI